MQDVLVIGGAGYIGAHTAKALAEAGFRPVTFDDLSLGHERFVRWGPLERGDILDTDALRRVLVERRIAAVLHFAALAYVGESVTDPAKYYRNNVAGTMSILDALRAAGSPPIVFSSTCAVYGQPDATPITERTPTAPINPYGRTKLMCEEMIRDYGAAYGIRSVCLRYFNACGADASGEIGEDRDPEPHLIPRALLAALGRIDDFQVFGSDYPTPDGTAIRDYIHVSDLAAAHVAALRRLLGGAGSDVFNLGVGRGYSVQEVLAAATAVTGRNAPAAIGPRRPGDPAVLVADAAKARRELGFAPAHSDLDAIVSSAWAWHRRAHPRIVA